jgi:hypothetical protein
MTVRAHRRRLAYVGTDARPRCFLLLLACDEKEDSMHRGEPWPETGRTQQ